MEPITKITIEEGLCGWGPDGDRVNDSEARERQAIYESGVSSAIGVLFPGVTLEHDVDRRTDQRTRITVDRGADSWDTDRDVDRVLEVLGRCWIDACEATL